MRFIGAPRRSPSSSIPRTSIWSCAWPLPARSCRKNPRTSIQNFSAASPCTASRIQPEIRSWPIQEGFLTPQTPFGMTNWVLQNRAPKQKGAGKIPPLLENALGETRRSLLGEAGHRFGFRVVHVEDGHQLRDLKHFLELGPQVA